MTSETVDRFTGIYRAYTYIRERFIREPVTFRLHRVDLEALYDQHKTTTADDRTFDEATSGADPIAIFGIPTVLDDTVRPGTMQITVELPLVLIEGAP
ncbi:hypothetical protein Caci_2967 [Catenulispora acidiphila DSM 44928]|uniref:Uncharacterized protein n=1 Tax=Catenulispora acidiphila (strain DSM 44928 / JCM 14897 / NBRC 102108 / NRRL B-24433 / ID139908) TaxID=479433 RepID=C7Q2Y4_CATAD|nr:hypothetical protein [Catenulispora acidiphila]ACU71876.1 hypothetical protein Caci_2967 [Catenulispora acidiphila DSM 44928]